MDGQTNRQMDGQMDKLMERWMDGQTNTQMDGQMNKLIDRCIDIWSN